MRVASACALGVILLLSAGCSLLGAPELAGVPVDLKGNNAGAGWQGYITVNPQVHGEAVYDVEITWGAALQDLADNGLVHRHVLENVPEYEETALPFLTYVSGDWVSVRASVVEKVRAYKYAWTRRDP